MPRKRKIVQQDAVPVKAFKPYPGFIEVKYDPSYAEQVQKLCAMGAIDEEVADFFGVARRTIIRWRHTHADFAKAMLAGKDLADDRVERTLYQLALGYTKQVTKVFLPQGAKSARDAVKVTVDEPVGPSPGACIFWLKNRRREQWRDRFEHTGAGGGAIRLEAIDAAVGKMSDKELATFEKFIAPLAAAVRITPAVAGGRSAREDETER